ncbi:hypothetical protein O1M63_09705 [Streptomyces mirabilis]|nr:hypothetical protein [Streptomyces mirabilis]
MGQVRDLFALLPEQFLDPPGKVVERPGDLAQFRRTERTGPCGEVGPCQLVGDGGQFRDGATRRG